MENIQIKRNACEDQLPVSPLNLTTLVSAVKCIGYATLQCNMQIESHYSLYPLSRKQLNYHTYLRAFFSHKIDTLMSESNCHVTFSNAYCHRQNRLREIDNSSHLKSIEKRNIWPVTCNVSRQALPSSNYNLILLFFKTYQLGSAN